MRFKCLFKNNDSFFLQNYDVGADNNEQTNERLKRIMEAANPHFPFSLIFFPEFVFA